MAYPIRKAASGSVIDTTNPVANGIMGCYLFNEGSGNANDLAPSPVNISSLFWYDVGGVKGVEGFLVSIPLSTKYDWISGSFSVAVWFRCVAPCAVGEQAIICGR